MCCVNDPEGRERAHGWMLGGSRLADGEDRSQTGWLSDQRHIRQHMPTQPGIIIPAVLFASWADEGRALVVMGGLCRIMSSRVKTRLR